MEHESLKIPNNFSLISIKTFNGNVLPHGTNCFPSGFLATIFLFFEKVKSIFLRNDPTFELFAHIVITCCYTKAILISLLLANTSKHVSLCLCYVLGNTQPSLQEVIENIKIVQILALRRNTIIKDIIHRSMNIHSILEIGKAFVCLFQAL